MISNNQGLLFNKYQNKLKKKYRFVEGMDNMDTNMDTNSNSNILQNATDRNKITGETNAKDIQELKQMQIKFNDLVSQYNQSQTAMSNNSLATLKRLGPDNPYLNKYIKWSDNGTIMYVNSQGIAKPYNSMEIYNSTLGKNGCPVVSSVIQIDLPWKTDYTVPGTIIPTNPSLIVGTPMTENESCGNAGRNVYASTLISNPTSTYQGCYNNQPPTEDVAFVPTMNSNTSGGFWVGESSFYNNNSTYVGWKAFDNNTSTFWNSSNDSNRKYNSTTGIYEGISSVGVNTKNSGLQTIKGEFLQINMPNVNTPTAMKVAISKYGLRGRPDCCFNGDGTSNGRDPNSWYIIGWDGSAWNEIDHIENYNFPSVNFEPSYQTFKVNDTNEYSAFIIIITVNGNSNNNTGKRYSTQISSWNLYTSMIPPGSGDNSMTLVPNITNMKDCQEYAVNNDYKYFGTQNYQSNGTSQCLVSNELTMAQSYGKGSKKTTSIPIWASNTSGTDANVCFISPTGNIILKNASDQIIWQSPNSPEDCINGGKMNVDTLSATYGGNCKASTGNATDKVKQKYINLNNPPLLPIAINNATFGDPAPGCAKSWDAAYQCGTQWKTTHINKAEGQNFIFNCLKESLSCNFYAMLQDDGNLCLYRGNPLSVTQTESIWCSTTNGKQMQPNPNWIASSGKYGRNYMKLNETLAVNEWIGSTDGSLKLMMQQDGNLVLYSSQTVDGCVKGQDGQMYGTEWINALYEINETGYKSNLGKLGYINQDSKLQEYPSSMISQSNDYNIYPNYNSMGNDIGSVTAGNMDDCKTSCNNNENCFGFVWQPGPNVCYLKNNNTYPKSDRQQNASTTLGVRKPKLIGSSSCSNEIVEIDTIQYNNYLKGTDMSSETKCNQQLVDSSDRDKSNTLITELETLGQQIANKMDKMYATDNNLLNKMNMNESEFNKDLLEYKTISKKIDKDYRKKDSDNIEGMQNLNMYDINGILNDSDLRVLQENYSYIFWSILAVGLLTATVSTLKK